MKTLKNLKILLVIAYLVSFASCKNILEENPRSLVVPEKFFNSEEEIMQALNGVYSYLNSTNLYRQDIWNNSECPTDLTVPRPTALIYYTFQDGPGHPDALWNAVYAGINDANITIRGIKGSSAAISQQQKDQFIAEARFLRGLYYFILTNFFGGVPVWTDSMTDINKIGMLPRSSLSDVYKQINEDLSYSEQYLPVSYEGNVKSRATKGAAEAILARVSLFEKNWQQAKDEAQKVIDSKTYHLLPDYGDVFTEANENNDEVIFSVEFKTLVVETWRQSFYTPQFNVEGIPDFHGYGTFLPSEYFLSIVKDNDLRKPQLLMSEWKGKKLTRTYFGPKFLDVGAPVRGSGKDFIISRYAGVLLILAEAENELNGPTQVAYNAINEVRKRAGLPGLSGLSKDEFRNAVIKERGIELVGEGLRRWDLVRWGKYVETLDALDTSEFPYAHNFKPYMVLYPIPDAELVKNPNLKQNPGY